MALLYSSPSFFLKTLRTKSSVLSSSNPTTLPFYFNNDKCSRPLTSSFPTRQKPTFLCHSFSESDSDSGSDDDPNPDPNLIPSPPITVTDEWGDKAEPEPESESPKLDADPPKNEDEWGYTSGGNGSAPVEEKDARIEELKRCLVDTVYGTNFGFEASTEVRGEVLELVNQLEALNPASEPVYASEKLDGNWVLLYTAFSELLPLLAVGSVPLLKVEKISQTVDSSNLSIVNSTTLSSPFATISFSATASFEVRSSSRIQVEFKEGTFQPPEIKSRIDIPANVDILGQNVNLSPVQQPLDSLQGVFANISRTISGQPPIKIPIPGDRSKSWLLITYLDEDLRISRGDGGLFVLIKEGSPLLEL